MSSSGSDLDPKDLRALIRLIARSRGTTFKLAIVEISSPAAVASLRDLVAQEEDLKSFALIDIKLRPQEDRNLWSELKDRAGSHDGPTLLFLSAIEMPTSSPETQQLFRQLNVQRDLFVRDLPFPWVVLIHPQVASLLRNIAPDFCDFASLWLKAENEPELRSGTVEIRKGLNYDARRGFGKVDGRFQTYLADLADIVGQGRLDEVADALARAELAASSNEEHASVAFWRAQWLQQVGRSAEAAALIRETLLTFSSETQEGRTLSAILLLELGQIQRQLGDFVEARSSIERSRKLFREQDGGQAYYFWPDLALAQVLFEQGELSSARELLERLVGHKSMTSSETAAALEMLGTVYLAARDFDAAKDALERSLTLQSEHVEPDSLWRVVSTLRALARVLEAQGKIDEAQATLLRAANADPADEIGHRLPSAGVFYDLGILLLQTGDLDGAKLALDNALEIELRMLGPEHESTATTLHALGVVAAEKGNLKEARDLQERALKGLAPESNNAATASLELAKLSMRLGDLGRARVLLDDLETDLSKLRSPELDRSARQARETLTRMLGTLDSP